TGDGRDAAYASPIRRGCRPGCACEPGRGHRGQRLGCGGVPQPGASAVDEGGAGVTAQAVEVLSLEGVDLVRSSRLILADIDITIRAGEHWALIGPNGAG